MPKVSAKPLQGTIPGFGEIPPAPKGSPAANDIQPGFKPKAPLPPPTPAKNPTKKKDTGREVKYPEIDVRLSIGEQAIWVEQAKEILGWEEETDTSKFGEDYLFKDELGNKIRCSNNCNNRPLDISWARKIAQDILRKHFKLNFETIIISLTALVISGQHRLIALILAHQIWERDRKHWDEYWKEPPFIESLVVYGASEDPKVTRTIDNTKPRSLSDVFYTSGMFTGKNTNPDQVEKVCKTAEWAVKLLWHRTGAKNDAFAKIQTHSEAVEFVTHHPKLVSLVPSMLTEYQGSTKKPIWKYITPGIASGFRYLMSAAQSKGDEYRDHLPHSEKHVDFSLEEKAREFWVHLVSGDRKIQPILQAYANLANRYGGESGPVEERRAILVKGWNEYADGAVTLKNVELKYTPKDGVDVWTEPTPVVGGIDVGDPKEAPDADEKQSPTPEEIEEAKKKLDEEKLAEKKKETPPQTSEPVKPKPVPTKKADPGAHPTTDFAGKPLQTKANPTPATTGKGKGKK